MIKAKKHKTDLVSIKPFFDKNWHTKILFHELLRLFSRYSSHILLIGLRPNDKMSQEDEKLIDSLMFESLRSNHLFDKEKDKYFGISLITSAEYIESKADDLYDIWFLYEQPTIVFGDEEMRSLDLTKAYNFSYDFFTIKSKYIVYRGVEDDVLWLGKNTKESFPDFDELQDSLKIS